MKIEFITEPDCTGKGLVIVDGRYYGLPLAAVMRRILNGYIRARRKHDRH